MAESINEIFKGIDGFLDDTSIAMTTHVRAEADMGFPLHELQSSIVLARAGLHLLHSRVSTDREVLLDALAFLVGIMKAQGGHMWHEWQVVLRRVEGILSENGKIAVAPTLEEPLP